MSDFAETERAWRSGQRPGLPSAGLLANCSVVELLVRARVLAFSGTLSLDPTDAPPRGLRFDGGSVVDERPGFVSEAETLAAIAELLPSEQRTLALEHARGAGTDLLASVEHLSLLPHSAVAAVRQDLLINTLIALCRLPHHTRYVFDDQSAAAAAHPRRERAPLDVLPAIVMCAHAELDNRKAKRFVASLGEVVIRLRPGTARFLLDALNGAPRSVVAALARRARSARALVVDGAARVDWVVTTLHALWLLQYLEIEAGDAQLGSVLGTDADPANVSSASGTRRLSLPSHAPHDTEERTSRTYVAAPHSGAAPHASSGGHSTLPPSRRSSLPAASPAEIASRELAMEKRVVDAWVLAESDPSLTEKAARFAHKATSIYPRNARIQFFTARLDAQCGRHREAARRLELALQIEPEYDDARRELNQLRQSMNTPAQTGFRLKDWFSRRERE